MSTRFGRYLLDRRLAIGGMAEVFLGRVEGPAGFEKKVVIKRILPHHSNDQRYVNMFLDEARIAARFNHPNLVQIHELAKIQGQFCMVMEYIEGKDLETVRDLCLKLKRYMPLPVLSFVIAETAEGLHYAHDLTNEEGEPLNVVHRDVSPANVIMTWIGGIKVVDFGIAKSRESSTETESGVIKGKFSYLSPEQAAGETLDCRSDIFSLGTILYELVTLTQCFTRASTFETLDAVAAADFTPPRRLRPDIPEELERILMKMLERKREDRYENAVAVSRQLRRFMADVGVPVANDVQTFLEDLFGTTRPQPDRSYAPLASSIEVPVDDEYSNPAVVVPESTRQHMLAEAIRELGLETMDLELTSTAQRRAPAGETDGTETVDLGKPSVDDP
jgi:serine/threonine-protein kinase